MSNPEFKHLRKVQLEKRVKLLTVLVYIAPVIGIVSFVSYFFTDYAFHWSWLITGVTYLLLTYSFFLQKRRMQKEIAFREERRENSKQTAQ